MLKETQYKDYYVDEEGNIYSAKRKNPHKLKQQTSNHGYRFVCISENGKEFSRYVHRIVVEAFYRKLCSEKFETVNHIDGNKTNNRLENLEIVSASENVVLSYKTGLHKVGEQHEQSRYSDAYLTKALDEIHSGCSVRSTAKKYGISQSYLNKIKNGVYRKSIKK